eukprot:873169_1
MIKKSCQATKIFVDERTPVDDVTIICSSRETDLKIDCNDIFSCHSLSVHLFGDTIDNEDDTLSATITCFEGSSCDQMTINTDNSTKLNLTLNMFQFSEKVSIIYEHSKDINVQCGFEDDLGDPFNWMSIGFTLPHVILSHSLPMSR